MKQYRLTDYSLALVSLALVSLALVSLVLLVHAVFLLAVLRKVGGLQVSQAAGMTVFYNAGELTPGLTGGWWQLAGDRAQHLVLPTLAVVLPSVEFYSRYQRSAMLDVLGSDFLRTAVAKGLRYRRALLGHGLRTVLVPMTTFFAYQFGLLLIGVTFTEKIFAWHAMGEWFIDSVAKSDVNVVAAVTLFAAVLVLLADLVYAALSPGAGLVSAPTPTAAGEAVSSAATPGHIRDGRCVSRRRLVHRFPVGLSGRRTSTRFLRRLRRGIGSAPPRSARTRPDDARAAEIARDRLLVAVFSTGLAAVVGACAARRPVDAVGQPHLPS